MEAESSPADAFAPERLMEEASSATGLSDFGTPDFLPGLEALARTYAESPLAERRRARACRLRWPAI